MKQYYVVKSEAEEFMQRLKRSLISAVECDGIKIVTMEFDMFPINWRTSVMTVRMMFTNRGNDMFVRGSVAIPEDSQTAVFQISSVNPGWLSHPDNFRVELSGTPASIRKAILTHLREFCSEHFKTADKLTTRAARDARPTYPIPTKDTMSVVTLKRNTEFGAVTVVVKPLKTVEYDGATYCVIDRTIGTDINAQMGCYGWAIPWDHNNDSPAFKHAAGTVVMAIEIPTP